tara:strand:+ start:12172 stop:13158 length:987 start_codon:yes stop_codon:yes gene_type:complete
MRIAITGEKGFIAKNLSNLIESSEHEFVSLDKSDFALKNMKFTKSGEVCVYRNSTIDWTLLFEDLKLDVIVHNAAVVGTDVVALNPIEAISTNILGSRIITDAANKAGILNVFIGTTVIYDTVLYQDRFIYENSTVRPKTDYAVQKYAAEMIVRNTSKDWLVIRPLFAYGGEGDMNSLIAKSIYSKKNNIENIDMFLNPEKIKDYMHVQDFCTAILSLINSDIRNEDYNVSALNPYKTMDIIKKIERALNSDLNSTLKWHPETDYLGNHTLDNFKIKRDTDWSPKIDLDLGIKMSIDSIMNDSGEYNPLKYLQEAKNSNVDLTKHFPK